MTTTAPEQEATPASIAATYAAPAVAGVIGAWEAWQGGKINAKIFFGAATQTLQLARLSITHAVEIAIARQVPQVRPLGKGIGDFTPLDTTSLHTVTDDPETAESRIRRYVESTLAQHSRDEHLELAAEYGATSWVWRTDGASCDFCQDREGKIFSMWDEFRDHPGCNCYPEAQFDAGFSDLAQEDMELEND